MGSLTFRFAVTSKNAERLPELAARCSDFSAPLASIVGEWGRSNAAKFDLSRGMEESGVYEDADTYWDRLTPPYMKQKRRKGMPDWLMVATGSLMNSLTTDGGYAEYVDAHQAVFGNPLDPEDALKAAVQSPFRRVIFLNQKDRLAIVRELKNYLGFGDNYKDLLFARGAAAVGTRAEQAAMDVDFRNALEGE